MAGFTKFDPRAFLESEERGYPPAKVAKAAKEVATLAGFAGGCPRPANRERLPESDVVKNEEQRYPPAKAAKDAKAARTDGQEERAALVERDGGAPRAWAEALARLDPNRPPGDVPLRRWVQFIDDCGRFLGCGWAASASALGWNPLDLFGCDRERPFARIDRAGLLWLLDGSKLVMLTVDLAGIEANGTGSRQTYRRKPLELGHVALAWELAG
jgi:hypothetical protein